MPTYVHFNAYRGFQMNLSPIRAPNPSCCSDVGVLCPECAAKVLRQEGITVNEGPTANTHRSGLTPVPPPSESAPPLQWPPKRTDTPGRQSEERPEPVKYSPSGVRLTPMGCPGEEGKR